MSSGARVHIVEAAMSRSSAEKKRTSARFHLQNFLNNDRNYSQLGAHEDFEYNKQGVMNSVWWALPLRARSE